MDFARLLEQAKDLWSRSIGKWIFGGIAAFIVAAAVLSYVWSRPTMVPLGKFEAAVAPQVDAKLTESKIVHEYDENFTFMVRQADYEKAKLLMAELNLDPGSAVWGAVSWKGMPSWSDTEFDKRRLWVEQMETNLSRAIRALSAVEQARVQITVPMEKPLFKQDEKPPKAMVVVEPKKGEQIAVHVVEAIMELVAGAVEGLERQNVTVVDSSKSKVVSDAAFKPQATDTAGAVVSNTQMTVLKQFQDRWQDTLTQQLEKVAGPGNVSVIVYPVINWDRVMEEVKEYKPAGADGKGVLLSEQVTQRTAEGTSPSTSGTSATGTTPNSEVGIPGYPGATGQQGGTTSEENLERISNYLVSETKRITDKPGGSIEEISVGILVNQKTVDANGETALRNVVATAMGSKAKVEVASLVFAPNLFDDLKTPTETTGPTGTPSLLYVLLAVALTLGAVGFGMLAFRPRKPVLEPVFAGPEAAMMGGIPVADLEMSRAVDAYGQQAAAMAAGGNTGLPQTPEDVAALAPEEIALLGDDFLQQLGVDPAKVRMREKVEKIAKANPEVVASLLKTWIQDG